MIRTIAFIAIVVGLLSVEASPRDRRDDKIERYCQKHQDHYAKYCSDNVDVDRASYAKLAKFCPAYEKHCAIPKHRANAVPSSKDGDLVIPPPLPKGVDFAALDLPLGNAAAAQQSGDSSQPAISKNRLTAAIIASCTPECTAAHCTDECKCAHTHPKVHAMCNPPASAEIANTCQRWYAKCPMFQPVQYY
ncbi:unnamed protein product [Auanema sp. JU1783]|nr:unnamed protein product [Auanema sp. JU1783]